MRHAMTKAAAFAVAALLGTIGVRAQADKPVERDKAAEQKPSAGEKAAQPGRPHDAAGPARPEAAAQRGNEAREKTDKDRDERGKSAEAHALAPGQNPDAREKRDEGAAPGVRANQNGAPSDEARAKRRSEQRAVLKERYGSELLQRPPVRAELERHAWRVARLARMRALAEEMTNATKRKKTLERLDKLAAKENARHERHMDQLKTQKNPPATAAEPPGLAKPDARKPAAKAEGPNQRAEKAGGDR